MENTYRPFEETTKQRIFDFLDTRDNDILTWTDKKIAEEQGDGSLQVYFEDIIWIALETHPSNSIDLDEKESAKAIARGMYLTFFSFSRYNYHDRYGTLEGDDEELMGLSVMAAFENTYENLAGEQPESVEQSATIEAVPAFVDEIVDEYKYSVCIDYQLHDYFRLGAQIGARIGAMAAFIYENNKNTETFTEELNYIADYQDFLDRF